MKTETKKAAKAREIAERIQARKDMIARIDAEVNATAIAKAVEPTKAEAIERAEKDAREYVAKLVRNFEEAGNDLNKIAPYPNSLRMGREEYTRAVRKRNLYASITEHRETVAYQPYRHDGPEFRDVSPAKIEQFVENAKIYAAEQYRAFVHKLVKKVGEHTAATLTGSHVWGFSILTVTLADGTVQKWKTQQIVNVSIYGLLFNQWPSRVVK